MLVTVFTEVGYELGFLETNQADFREGKGKGTMSQGCEEG